MLKSAKELEQHFKNLAVAQKGLDTMICMMKILLGSNATAAILYARADGLVGEEDA